MHPKYETKPRISVAELNIPYRQRQTKYHIGKGSLGRLTIQFRTHCSDVESLRGQDSRFE